MDRFATLSTKTKSEMINMEPLEIGDEDARLQLKAKPTINDGSQLTIKETDNT